jgi:CubicO group peptidase (beta-lactamase class C family)
VRRRGGDSPVGPEDRFHLGSCTKSMTATVLARTIERGELAWSTTLAEAFPDLAPGMHEAWRGVTLEQLVSHTAGAPENLLAYAGLGLELTLSHEPLPAVRRALVAGVTARAPVHAPGSTWLYSNLGYVIAASVLEEQSGEAWEERMRGELFEPLGMRSAGFGPPGAQDALDHPLGHDAEGEPRPGQDNPAFIGPAGTVHATLGDWASYVRLHLAGARGAEGLLLAPESFAALHRARPGTDGAYAAGWMVLRRPWSAGPVLAHNGSNTLWFAWVWIAPEEGFAVLVACNQGGDAGAKASDAAAALLIGEHVAALRASAGEAR